MSEHFVRIGIEIPLSLYANLDKIKNGSAASGRILEAVKNGNARETIRHVIINLSPYGKFDGCYDESRHLIYCDPITKEYIDLLGWKIEEDNNG